MKKDVEADWKAFQAKHDIVIWGEPKWMQRDDGTWSTVIIVHMNQKRGDSNGKTKAG